MLPRFDLDGHFTHAEIIGFTIALLATTFFPGFSLGHSSILYLVGMAVSGAFFLYYGVKLVQSSSRASASHLLHASVIYLPVVLAVMMVCKR
jgi:heme O synthase-like polyprenyltransferase